MSIGEEEEMGLILLICVFLDICVCTRVLVCMSFYGFTCDVCWVKVASKCQFFYAIFFDKCGFVPSQGETIQIKTSRKQWFCWVRLLVSCWLGHFTLSRIRTPKCIEYLFVGLSNTMLKLVRFPAESSERRLLLLLNKNM